MWTSVIIFLFLLAWQELCPKRQIFCLLHQVGIRTSYPSGSRPYHLVTGGLSFQVIWHCQGYPVSVFLSTDISQRQASNSTILTAKNTDLLDGKILTFECNLLSALFLRASHYKRQEYSTTTSQKNKCTHDLYLLSSFKEFTCVFFVGGINLSWLLFWCWCWWPKEFSQKHYNTIDENHLTSFRIPFSPI